MASVFKARNYYFKEILAALFLILAIYFFRKQRAEIQQAFGVIGDANIGWVIAGIAITVCYIMLHMFMYQFSFRAVQHNVTWGEALRLFLKRNLVSIFLPGGGVTSLVFFTSEIERKGISKSKIGFASYIYGVAGFASLALVALPVIGYLAFVRSTSGGTWAALAALAGLAVLLFFSMRSFLARGWVYRLLYRVSPQIEALYIEIGSGQFSSRMMVGTLVCSVGVELTGMLHLFIAMKALGVVASPESCIAGYTIATLFYAISPFLRGLGAVEVSLIVVLQSYGIPSVEALSTTVLYRVFEFWLPLVAGLGAFFFVRGSIILRFLPGLLLALLGIVNIFSAITPPLADRMRFLTGFLPLDLIHFSSVAVALSGILLLCCSAFLIRGLRNAWWLALFLAVFSLVGNILKGIDYEEASLALFTVIILAATRSNYRVKGDPRLRNFGVRAALISLSAVLLYGVIGFYFLDRREFSVDFSLRESVIGTLRSFFLLTPQPLPLTRFAEGFVHSLNLLGCLSMGLFVYVFIKPFVFKGYPLEEDREQAKALVERFGRSADDYFKVYPDKACFFPEGIDGFVSYKTSSGFAVVLGEPVCADHPETVVGILTQFERFCKNNGLNAVYYKVAEDKWAPFLSMGKKTLPIGLEAIVDLSTFTLEGKDRKSLRNALNALSKKGFHTVVYHPPIKEGLLQKLKYVSDNWIQSMGRREIVFSSGMFDWQELRNQSVITMENSDERVVGFLNIVPDYVAGEGTYDLIRKTSDAPSGVMDALIVTLIDELKARDKQWLNMGMAAMTGIDRPKGLPEWTIKFAYERLGQFRHYHGLFEFKDKFSPRWVPKYLIYGDEYDLVSLPMALTRVTRP